MVKIFLYLFLITEILFGSVGKIVTFKGDVTLLRAEKQLVVKSGLEIEEKDIIKTSSNGKLQLIFNDDTLITIGKESEFSIKKYLYEENNKNPQAEFGMTKGTFRTITGAIGKIAPQNFKLTSKTASIGIRGTQIYAEMKQDFDFLACTEGMITVTSLTTGQTIDVPAGSFTIIKPNQAPQAPKTIEAGKINNEETTVSKDADTNLAINDIQIIEIPNLTSLEETIADNFSNDNLINLFDTSNNYYWPIVMPYYENGIPSHYSFFEPDFRISKDIDSYLENLDEKAYISFWHNFETTFSPTILNSNQLEDIIWGEWANETSGISGYFVKDIPTEYNTIPTTGTASYTGFTKAKDSGNMTYNGSINLIFNFANNSLNGTIAPGNGVTYNISSLGSSSSIDTAIQKNGVTNGRLTGNFYGDGASTLAGGFEISTGSPKLSGIYAATKE